MYLIPAQYSAPCGNLQHYLNDWSDKYIDTSNIILSGDFNIHLRTMGHSRENHRSVVLLEFSSLTNLSIINNPQTLYTYVQDGIKGRPDLTLLGNNII